MKQLLTTDELIAHMKQKGITFQITSEQNAQNFLSQNNYYMKLASYRENYPKYTSGTKTGQYINLDFAYLQELSEDVLPIDALISFASSEKGAEVFGAEQAKSMAEAGKASKANGGKYCICPACSAGGAILDKKNEIL